MRVSGTEEMMLQTSAKKANLEHVKQFQIVFGLDQRLLTKTAVVPYNSYLSRCDALKSTAEFQSVINELSEAKSRSPVVMVVKNQGKEESFRLEEFYDMLNANPTNLEQVVREHVNPTGPKTEIQFTQEEFYTIRDLLDTVDSSREVQRQLESLNDDTVVASSDKAQLTAGEIKKSLNIKFSGDKPLNDSEKALLEKVKNVGKGANIELPHQNFDDKSLKQVIRTHELRGRSAGQFNDISVAHKATINKELAKLKTKSLDEFLFMAVTQVGRVNNDWVRAENRKPKSGELRANIMQGLNNANDLLKKQQVENQTQKAKIASSPESNLSNRLTAMQLALEEVECEARISCFEKLHTHISSKLSPADVNRANLQNPEFLREGWTNSPGMVHRQRSQEEITHDWPTPEESKVEGSQPAPLKSTEKNSAKEIKVEKRQPAPLTTQRSLNEDEFEKHMSKVESAESQNPTEKNSQSEGATSGKQRSLSLSRSSGSESARDSPLIQRLVGMSRQRAASVSASVTPTEPKPKSESFRFSKK